MVAPGCRIRWRKGSGKFRKPPRVAVVLFFPRIRSTQHDWISCVGWVSEPEKLRLLQSASLLLVPSKFEGQPLVILEALACGLQVLTSDQVFSIPQSVNQAPYQNKDEWVLKILQMLKNPIPSSILVEQASPFSVRNISAKWLKLYSTLLLEHE